MHVPASLLWNYAGIQSACHCHQPNGFAKERQRKRESIRTATEVRLEHGIPACTVNRPADVAGAVAAALAHDGPALINFEVAQEENVYPMIPSGKTIKDMIESEEARLAPV